MPRRDALLRLKARLVARRNALRKALESDLAGYRWESEGRGVGDPGDAAVDTANDEISSQLFEMESRELGRIEEALARIAAGTYGRCEHCGGRIAATRLVVLPYAESCIDCQREIESQRRPKLSAADSSWRGMTFDDSSEGGDEAPLDLRDVELASVGSVAR